MITKAIVAALASGALISASAALAQHGPGGGHGPPGGMPSGSMGNSGAMGGIDAGNASSGIGMMTRDDARINSQGAANASATGIAHANSNSVLAGTSGSTALTGVTVGMPVMQNGVQVGSIQRIVTNHQGVIVRVLVRGTNGQILSLSPGSLSLSGSTLTTTAMLRMH